jgi:hypothetical protein
MTLNIKDKETLRLIHEITRLTGESETTAVTIAIRERPRLEAGAAAGRTRLGQP